MINSLGIGRTEAQRTCVECPLGENNRNGFNYGLNKQVIYFFKITEEFADEVHAQLILSRNIECASKERQLVLKEKLKKLPSQIAGFIKYFESQNSK